ncbi:hypothetical protein SMACR_05382 [Sordaria macrospora]|uniref:WGS project CABT00000000 data, contig 2.6 n=2 Tax=Sordaria macrospora TaxID=5147 RepID=F7VSS4_SORMK|nr:uncharacterized protein SMAC_05382 [Sordaria macrospora k-hell]KAA8628511.1 hypothetical protein SMACR_05382 [Sordaria macrospora]KAH7628422.1 hypothetical protein B0T09DRAFT_309057 [Sordaria sp. MPI-SDFR-AT-0083]WPJ57630.1 hypothetical protein SMAC4_05382 [Sordaria macrospora]CCC08741.1 unnamed protein product [Sordaria macrospora k-hell]
MPASSADETSTANTAYSSGDNTTGIMTNISLTPRASLESSTTVTPPSQQNSNHQHHDPHSPPCSPPGSPDHDHEHKPSSADDQHEQNDQQKVHDQDPELLVSSGRAPDHHEAQEDSVPEQKESQLGQPHQQHKHSSTSSSTSSSVSSTSSSASAETNPNQNNKDEDKTALNEFITRSRSSTLYTPSNNERDEQIRIAILMRCLGMEERFQVQAARYWGRLQ